MYIFLNIASFKFKYTFYWCIVRIKNIVAEIKIPISQEIKLQLDEYNMLIWTQ